MTLSDRLSNLPRGMLRALIASQALALAWWLVALWLKSRDILPVWFDQERIFLQVGRHIGDPYSVVGYYNPPWTAIPLAPFGWLPVSAALLLQLCLYFAILTGVVYKFGGGFWRVILTLTCFMAFDSALELNVD